MLNKFSINSGQQIQNHSSPGYWNYQVQLKNNHTDKIKDKIENFNWELKNYFKNENPRSKKIIIPKIMNSVDGLYGRKDRVEKRIKELVVSQKKIYRRKHGERNRMKKQRKERKDYVRKFDRFNRRPKRRETK